jgi:hypothetical protein
MAEIAESTIEIVRLSAQLRIASNQEQRRIRAEEQDDSRQGNPSQVCHCVPPSWGIAKLNLGLLGQCLKESLSMSIVHTVPAVLFPPDACTIFVKF